MDWAYLVVRRFGIAGHLHVISSTEDFAGLFEGVFSFTSDKEAGNSSILRVKLAVAMLQTQLVEKGTGSIKGFDGARQCQSWIRKMKSGRMGSYSCRNLTRASI